MPVTPICDGLGSDTTLNSFLLLTQAVFRPTLYDLRSRPKQEDSSAAAERDNCCILFLTKILLRQHVDATDCRARDEVRDPGGARVPRFSGRPLSTSAGFLSK